MSAQPFGGAVKEHLRVQKERLEVVAPLTSLHSIRTTLQRLSSVRPQLPQPSRCRGTASAAKPLSAPPTENTTSHDNPKRLVLVADSGASQTWGEEVRVAYQQTLDTALSETTQLGDSMHREWQQVLPASPLPAPPGAGLMASVSRSG
jgi:hypothetical protein